jgi:hypothetical protein
MKTATILLLSAILMIGLSGCNTPSRAMQRFVGQPSTELIAQWGPPQERISDGQGGEIWIYSEQRQWTTPGQANTTVYGTRTSYGNLYGNPNGAEYYGNSSGQANITTTYTPPQTRGYTAHRSFFIDGNGTVYRWAWKGL